MSDEKQLTTVEPASDLAEYGDRETVVGLGLRLRSMLPGGENLNNAQAMALAQYALITDTNPFRGDVYGYTDRHGFHLVEGYKALVRWARNKCPYTESYKPFPVADGDIGQICYILREDAREALRDFVELGATFREAYELAAVSAVGVVTKREASNDPPKGWTWEQVAKKRALKNALNLSHGAPSPREIAKQSWDVEGVETSADDWQGVTRETPQREREAIAEGNARHRQAHENAQAAMAQGMTADDAMLDLGFEPLPPRDSYEGAPVDEGAYADYQEILEDEAEPPTPEPPAAARTWPGEIISAIVDANLARPAKHAVKMLNLSNVLSTTDELPFVMTWANHYRGQREAGKDPHESAKWADAQMPKEGGND